MKSLAIADERGRVSLWCDGIRRHRSGRVSFEVINGAWTGSIKDGVVTVNATKGKFPGTIVWEGNAPFAPHRYNEAIAWIEQQLAAPENPQ